MDLLKPKEAAKRISISYQTLKQWIYQGKIRSVKTPGGHHRIPQSEVARLMAEAPGDATHRATKAASAKPHGSLSLDDISARNKLQGIITELHDEGLFTQIVIEVGEQQLVSIIPEQACRALNLRAGMRVYALFKAFDVMVVKA